MHLDSVAKLWFVTVHPWEYRGQLKGDILLTRRCGEPPCCFWWLSLFVVVCSCWLNLGCICAFTFTCWAVVCGLQIHLHWCFHARQWALDTLSILTPLTSIYSSTGCFQSGGKKHSFHSESLDVIVGGAIGGGQLAAACWQKVLSILKLAIYLSD